MGLAWALVGILCFVSIIFIPFGVAAFRISGLSFFPFGKEIRDRKADSLLGDTPLGIIGNVIWIILFGWWLAFGHLISALLLTITIIGIPFAWQHLKLAWLSFAPFSKEIAHV